MPKSFLLSIILHVHDILLPSGVINDDDDTAPPDLALSVLESSRSPQQLECFNFCYGKGYDMDKDETFMTWKTLNLL